MGDARMDELLKKKQSQNRTMKTHKPGKLERNLGSRKKRKDR